MNRLRIVVLCAVVLGFVFFTVGWSLAQGPQGQGAQGRPRLMCQDRFTSLDQNKDGWVDIQEFASISHRRGNAEDIFKGRDVNGDSLLNQDEFCGGSGMGRGRMQQQ